jgi:nicotinamidase-related amidase
MTDSEKINTICLLLDVQEQYLTELEPHMQKAMKHYIGNALNAVKLMRKKCTTVIKQEDEWGASADHLRSVIDEIVNNVINEDSVLISKKEYEQWMQQKK